jgi:REP-associated tyrosine transposase
MEVEKLEEGEYYHIFNRGINRTDIFREQRNYDYFLQKYQECMSDVVDTLAYNLLKNHFHLFVFVKENIFVPRKIGEGEIRLNASKQLGHLFNGYAQGFNKVYNRTGGLFESPFHRKLVDSDEYITSLLYYIHNNAAHHNLVTDFKEWPYTSYHKVMSGDSSIVKGQFAIDWFGGKSQLENYHRFQQKLERPDMWMLEDE